MKTAEESRRHAARGFIPECALNHERQRPRDKGEVT